MLESAGDKEAGSFASLTENTIVGHYKIISKIGAGGMGEVYLAEDTKLNRKVALKFPPSNLSQGEDSLKRFAREAQAAAALKHPNIVTIYEVSEYKGRPFFAMEHLEGRSLVEVIKSRKVSTGEAVDLAMQLCEGLREAHQAGVIHRDIKPSNIILDKNGRPRLLDFGLATVKGSEKLTATGSTLGTVGYMSPEQVQGHVVDQRSDLFSLGVLLYELVTGRAPFREEYEAATFYAIVAETPEPMARYKAGVSDELQQIVSKLLEKDPALRYQSAEGVLSDLKRLAVSGSDGRVPVSARRKKKLRRIVVPSSAVALLVLLILLLKPWRFEIASDNPAVAAPRRLAVLYLTNRGAAEDEYLSYGITEDLIVDLTRIGTMGVAPMPSILKYKDSNEELKEVAKGLHVGLVLNGSIHRSGDLIRVSAQLIDVEKESNLWADRWEETFEKLPRIKEALAQGISQALAIDTTVMQAAQVGTPDADNPEAYDYYLRGKYTFEHKSDESDVEVALGLFRKALELEPTLLAARRGVAAVLALRGQYDEANEELTTALEEARQRNLRSDEAEALLSLAGTHESQSLFDEAQEYAEQAREVSKELNDLAGEVKALTMIIAIHQARGMFSEAVALFDRILEINRHLNDQAAVASSLNNIGNIYSVQGDYANSLQNYEQALEISTRLGDQRMIGVATTNIGNIYSYQGDYAKALQNYEQALEISTRLGDQRTMGKATMTIALTCMNRGDYAKALQYYEQALEIVTRLGDQRMIGMVTANTGVTYEYLGDYAKALQYYEQALEIATQIGDQRMIGVVTGWIGNVYSYQGDYARALQNYEQALEVSTRIGDRSEMAITMITIGQTYMYRGDYAKALHNCEQALDISTQIGEQPSILNANYYLAAIYGEQGDYRKSNEYARKFAEAALALGNPDDSVWASGMLASVIMHTGEYDEAISTLNRVMADAERLEMTDMVMSAQQGLGMAFFYKGETDQAKKHYHAALKSCEDLGERSAMDGLNNCLGELFYFLNAPDSSRKYFEQSLALADEMGKKATQVRASGYLAALTARGGDFDGGVKRLRAILEEAKGHGNIENKVVVRRLLGQVLTENGRSEANKEEGRTILEEALSLAREKGIAHEIKRISELLAIET
jgi:serine/threonine protein kinase/Tfp pilus assembly protein PilF